MSAGGPIRPALLLLFACKPDPTDTGTPVTGPLQPLSDAPYTTLQGTWAPNEPSEATAAAIGAESFTVFDLDRYDAMGLGVAWDPAGVPWLERTDLDPDFAPGANRRSLLYVWQAADPQLIDEESPVRLEAWDGLYRPNGHLTTQTWEAHVATAARISQVSGRPFELALVAGDLTDGSGRNELDWFVRALVGGGLDPDSGRDDDPIPGEGNDYNDPFEAVGLDVPWVAALGNHDSTYNGGFGPVTDEVRGFSVGTEVYDFPVFPNGFRDGSTKHAEVRTEGPTPADPDRLVLYRKEVLAALHRAGGSPPGHGLTDDDVEAERGWFSVRPVPGKPLRVVVLDTVHSWGLVGEASMGFVSLEQLDWLRATLAEADAAHELVLVMSHHRLQDLGSSSEVSGDDLAGVLAASDGVFLLVTGHGHANTEGIWPQDFDGADPTLGFWQLMLASTVDFPMHSRVIEVVDEGDGHLSVYCTNLDHNSPEGSLPHLGRAQAAGKWAFPGIVDAPDVAGDWASNLDSMNHLLRIRVPDAVAAELARHDFPSRIESETTLLGFTAP